MKIKFVRMTMDLRVRFSLGLCGLILNLSRELMIVLHFHAHSSHGDPLGQFICHTSQQLSIADSISMEEGGWHEGLCLCPI